MFVNIRNTDDSMSEDDTGWKKPQRHWVRRLFDCNPCRRKHPDEQVTYLSSDKNTIHNCTNPPAQTNSSVDASTQTDSLEYTPECCICLNKIQKIYAMECGHTLVCLRCLRNKNQKLTECPICRKRVRRKFDRRIYIQDI